MNTITVIIISIVTVVLLSKGFINLLILEKEQPYQNPVLYLLWMMGCIMCCCLIIFMTLVGLDN